MGLSISINEAAAFNVTIAIPGPEGPAGPIGPIGPQGPAGEGVPVGGLTGQVLSKATDADYDTQWVNVDDVAAVWGQITGTLTNQTDLVTYVSDALASGQAVAKVLEVEVRNQTGSTLTAGTIVYIDGATGNKPTVTKAIASGDSTSAQTLGFIKADIANNGTGKVVVRGLLENIDTSALTEGQQLYLSGTTAGTWQTTKPVAPIHLVYVGIVTRAHPTLGTIEVAIQNGYELDELHDVLIVSPTNGQVLKYDSATSLWKNQADASGVAWGAITGTLSSQTDLQNALNAKASLSGATFTGAIEVQSGLQATGGGYVVDLNSSGIILSITSAGDNVNISPSAVQISDGVSNTMYVSSSNIVFPDSTIQTTAYTGSSAAVWGNITGTLSDQTDLQSALNAKANLSGAAFTGDVTASANTITARRLVGQPNAGVAGVNIGTGGTDTANTTPGDLWIPASGTTLNYRDATGSWRQVLTTSQIGIIDTSATNPALRVTQRGSGEAFRVEDSNTPDATAFVISNSGRVGIGVTPDSSAALKVDTNGIMFGDGTVQTTAATYNQNKAIADMLTSAINSVSGDGSGYTAYFSAPWTQYMSQVVNLSNFTANGGTLTFDVDSFTSSGGAEYVYLYYNGVQATFPFFYIPV